MPLSVKEQAFVRHFLAGQSGVRGNASRAYIAAGYAPKAAYSGASELLRKPRIQDAIAAYLRKADLTVDRVLEELRRLSAPAAWILRGGDYGRRVEDPGLRGRGAGAPRGHGRAPAGRAAAADEQLAAASVMSDSVDGW
jgi:hypothetical protein